MGAMFLVTLAVVAALTVGVTFGVVRQRSGNLRDRLRVAAGLVAVLTSVAAVPLLAADESDAWGYVAILLPRFSSPAQPSSQGEYAS